MEDPVTVHIVEDEEPLANFYASLLRSEYDVEVSLTGCEAVSQIDEETDVVILDRRLPDSSGREVLDTIEENDYDCLVGAVTAVDAEFEIVDMDVDDYLVKPIDDNELLDLVDRLVSITDLTDEEQELFQISRKISALEESLTVQELERHERYQELVQRQNELEQQLADQTSATGPSRIPGLTE